MLLILIVIKQSVMTIHILENKGWKRRLVRPLLAIYVVTFLLFYFVLWPIFLCIRYYLPFPLQFSKLSLSLADISLPFMLVAICASK